MANGAFSIRDREPLVSLIVRAKKNFVAWFEPGAAEKKRGRPRKYGMKIVLEEFFDHPDFFTKETCEVYGRVEDALIGIRNLYWKPVGTLVRFVLAETSRGRIVLMCNDLEMDPLIALRLYCARTRIEIAFDMLKNVIGSFSYRFWTRSMPQHSRKPKKNDELKKPVESCVETVEKCWTSIEGFVTMGAISLGLLQLISLKFNKTFWNYHDSFLRTKSRRLPSERSVKNVASSFLRNIFLRLAAGGITRKIQDRISVENSLGGDSLLIRDLKRAP